MILNYGNVFNPMTWMLAGGTTLWLCVHPPRRASVILAAAATAALAGLIQGISIFLAAMASHSSTGGPIAIFLSPFLGLQAVFIAFPLAWGIWGWILARDAGSRERWIQSTMIVLVGAWIAWHQIESFQLQEARVQDPAKLQELYNRWDRITRAQKVALIHNPHLPLEILADIPKRESNPFVLSELAQSWRVPEAALKLLAASSDKQVYCKVAWSNSAQGPLLAELYRQHPGDCDYNVALNANTQPEILTALATSKTNYVRWAVAANPQTPEAVLSTLAHQPDPELRKWMKRNPKLPASLRNSLP